VTNVFEKTLPMYMSLVGLINILSLAGLHLLTPVFADINHMSVE